MNLKKKEIITVGELVFGKAQIALYRIEGKVEGPKIGLVGMTHGTEYIGAKIIHQLFNNLNPEDIKGSIIAIPIANPFAVAAKNNNTPSGIGQAFSTVSLNSQYPGNKNGGLSKQLAATIFNLIKDVDYLVDIHSGTIIGKIKPQARLRTDEQIGEEIINKSKKLAKYSNLEVNIQTKSSDIANTSGILTTQASYHSIAAVTLELFGGDVTNDQVEFGLNTINNILKGVGILKGEPQKSDQQIYTKLSKVYSPQAGLINFKKDIGEKLKKGEIYATITNLLTDQTSDLVAPFDGILGFRVSFGILNKGDYIGEFLSF